MLGGDGGATALAVRVDGDAAAETAGGRERKRELGTRESERQGRESERQGRGRHWVWQEGERERVREGEIRIG